MRPPETFETGRLAARPPTIADAPSVFAAYASDPEITRYLAWKPYTEVPPLAKFLSDRAQDWARGGPVFVWMLCPRGGEVPIGSIGFTAEEHHAVFGYVLGKSHWQQGLMTEALRYLVDWTLSQPECFRASAYCHPDNVGSARVMEKAGMEREGLLHRWGRFPNLSSEPLDCLVYAKTR